MPIGDYLLLAYLGGLVMKKDNSTWAKQLSISLALSIGCCGAAFAQGMAEYAGAVSATPRVPVNKGMTDGLSNMFAAPGKVTDRAIRQTNAVSSSASTSVQTSRSAGAKPAAAKPAAKGKGGIIVSGDMPGGQAEAARAAVLEITKLADASYKAGIDLKKKGKLDEAEVQLRKSLVARQRYWADRDKQIPEIQLMLGEINNTRGQDAKAVTDLEGALASYSKFYGPGSDNRIKPLLLLSDSQTKLGEKVKAYESYSQAYRLATRAKLDAYNPSEMRLTSVKMALGVDKFRDAVDMCEIAVNGSERAKLSQDQLLSVMTDYATALKGMNRTRDANEILAEAEKIKGSAPATEAPPAPPKTDAPTN